MRTFLLLTISLSSSGAFRLEHGSNSLRSAARNAEMLQMSTVAEVEQAPVVEKRDGQVRGKYDIFACPESLEQLKQVKRRYGPITDEYFTNDKFGLTYRVYPDMYYDLTVKAEKQKNFLALSRREKVGQRFFQNPFISAVYERGYRQMFETAGFPGIDKEFAEANGFFTSAKAETIMDLSCGSGFMTRKFSQSGSYKRIIAGDLSPTMLAETRRRCVEESVPLMPEFVRCDSARLPFQSNSLDAIHAGAAMHCWPNVNQSIAEIYRVLKPGGVFYASTFFVQEVPFGRREFNQNSGFYFFSSEAEIEAIVGDAGGFSGDGGMCVVRREGTRCAIIKAVKYPAPEGLNLFSTPSFPSSSSTSSSSSAVGEEKEKAVSASKSVVSVPEAAAQLRDSVRREVVQVADAVADEAAAVQTAVRQRNEEVRGVVEEVQQQAENVITAVADAVEEEMMGSSGTGSGQNKTEEEGAGREEGQEKDRAAGDGKQGKNSKKKGKN